MARSTLKADALVLASRWDAESREQGDGMLDAAVGLVFNSRTYDLDLEVRPPSGAAFRVTGRYKSPAGSAASPSRSTTGGSCRG
jgi:hypothetical protein